MVVENAHALHGDSVAAAEVADELFGACVDLENFFDHVALEVAAAAGGGAKGAEEEELEWLSNKDAFPAVKTMLPPAAAPRPQEKGAPRPRRVVAKAAVAGRRCRHCGTEETPQWREGSSGRATLCNACGLRYRSGRLVPEYRPAGSPSFSRELHSNIHRRVVEMRRLREAAAMASPAPPSRPPSRSERGVDYLINNAMLLDD